MSVFFTTRSAVGPEAYANNQSHLILQRRVGKLLVTGFRGDIMSILQFRKQVVGCPAGYNYSGAAATCLRSYKRIQVGIKKGSAWELSLTKPERYSGDCPYTKKR